MRKKQRLIVIGGVAAGTKAASKARRESPEMDIVILTDEEYISYAGCGLAYYIGGVSPREKLFARTPDAFRSKHNIEVLLGHRAERINTYDSVLTVRELASGKISNMPYDKLLISTGASPSLPSVPGIDSKGVFTLRNIPDADSIENFIRNNNPRKAFVIGGGYIGMEIAENFSNIGISTEIFEIADRVMSDMFDCEITDMVTEKLTAKGVEIHTGTAVEKINTGAKGSVNSVIAGGKEFDCDIVIVATGVKPNVGIAKDARIVLGETGAIKVNRQMETSVRGIYAAGDCAETINMVSGKPCWVPLGSTANKQGRVAGANIAGKKKVFPGVLGASIVKIFDCAAGRTGLTESAAKNAGFNPISVMINAGTKAGYFPGGKKIALKLIADIGSEKILGCQAFGEESVDKIIDTVSASMAVKSTIGDLVNLDLAYSPPFSGVLGPVIVAAHVLEEKLT